MLQYLVGFVSNVLKAGKNPPEHDQVRSFRPGLVIMTFLPPNPDFL